LKTLPDDRRYAVVLCLIIIGAALFFASRVPRPEEPTRTTRAGRPIIEQDGKTLLWAGQHPDSEETRWWDMTDSPINPDDLGNGLGADKIASIDEPVFAHRDDSRWHPRANPDELPVIGVVVDGEARAYPTPLMSRHELVNDAFGDAFLTVAY